MVEKGWDRVYNRHFVKNCPRATLYLGVPVSLRLHMTLPFVIAEARYESKICHPTCMKSKKQNDQCVIFHFKDPLTKSDQIMIYQLCQNLNLL